MPPPFRQTSSSCTWPKTTSGLPWGLNDVVVRGLFAAGLDLQAALGLIGDHRAAGKICHAVDELDQAIRDIRNTIFEHPAPNSHPGSA